MAWKRSSVRSRSGPPNNFNQFSATSSSGAFGSILVANSKTSLRTGSQRVRFLSLPLLRAEIFARSDSCFRRSPSPERDAAAVAVLAFQRDRCLTVPINSL